MTTSPNKQNSKINFDNSYSRLPERFFKRQNPTPVSKPELIKVNHDLSKKLGIDPIWLESEKDGLQIIAGNKIPEGADPIATAYAGHQFAGWSPQLGDGRAILLGEVITPQNERFDFQLKGSGRTFYSRNGDGRAPLGPILREYIVSEAMHYLNIPTARTLAAAKTGELVQREESLPGAILIRIAQSHIRIGTFEYFAFRQDLEGLKILTDHVIKRHFPEAQEQDRPVLYMLNSAIKRQADLIASWQALGFIHGVMNTDNMLLSGETIDYGPCAFMDYFDPLEVYSYIDRQGRYAYANQPAIGQWNLAQLAQSLLPLLDEDLKKAIELAQKTIDAYPSLYEKAYYKKMREKIGLETDRKKEDESLINDLLAIMAKEKMDYTLTFCHLSNILVPNNDNTVEELITFPDSLNPWLEKWKQRLEQEEQNLKKKQELMRTINPIFIPRNHLVEEAIQMAIEQNDLSAFHSLLDTLKNPYSYNQNKNKYAQAPKPNQIIQCTFCGT